MSAHKLSLMQQFNAFPSENVCYVFMASNEGVNRFYEISQSAYYQSVIYDDAVSLVKITNGVFPVILLLENGEMVHEYEFRSMNEKEIERFMKE